MRHGVPVGGNELAVLVLPDAKGRVLDLVVVDLPVKADADGRDVGVVRHLDPLAQGDLGVRVLGAAKVGNVGQGELLHDADLTDHVDLLAAVGGEVLALEVGRSGVGAAVDLLGTDVEAKGEELLEVALAALRGVVRDEDELLSRRREGPRWSRGSPQCACPRARWKLRKSRKMRKFSSS